MEKIVIKVQQTSLRNEGHFKHQLTNRSHVYENKKAYNRKRMKKIEY